MNILHFSALFGFAVATTAFATGDIPNYPPAPKTMASACKDSLIAVPRANAEASVTKNEWEHFSYEANAASESGNDSLAADQALKAFCTFPIAEDFADTRINLAATAIEYLLDAKRFNDAHLIFDKTSLVLETIPRIPNSALLHFQMAKARLRSFEDLAQEALGLRISIQPLVEQSFGSHSKEAVINRVRTDNLKLQLGVPDEALSDLELLNIQESQSIILGNEDKLLLTRSLASAYSLAGREIEALVVLRSTRDEIESKQGDDSPHVIRLDQSISEILTRINPSEEALETASRVYLWRYAHIPQEDAQTLRSLWQLAYLYSANAQIETSRSILRLLSEKAAAGASTFSRQFQLQIISLDADLDFKQGDYQSALTRAEIVYRGALEALGEDAIDTQTAAANLAIVLRRAGDNLKGCTLLKKIEAEIKNSRPGGNWTLEFARIENERCKLETNSPQLVDQALNALKNSWDVISSHTSQTSQYALDALGVYSFALLDSNRRSDAIKTLERYVSLTEHSRNDAVEGSVPRLGALSSWIFESAPNVSPNTCYRQLALLHAQDEELERALRVSELARDRTLGDHFAEQEWLRNVLPAPERQRLEPLLDRIQGLDERLAVTPDLMERVRLESERTIAVAQRGRMERELRQRLHLAEPESVPPTLDELREHIDGRTALASLVHSGDAWWVLVVTRDAPARFVPLHDADLGRNASAWVRRLRGEPVRAWPLAQGGIAIDDLRPVGAAGPFLSTDQLGRRLSASLLEPLAAAVGKARHLVFVGDDELVGVPLQALPLGAALAVDRFDISYAPSLTTYARWQGRRTGTYRRDLLAIGAVVNAPRIGPASDDNLAISLAYAADHPLPFAREEIDAIAALFAADRRRSLTGAAARKSWLRQASHSGELAGYRYVHLATHAWADADQAEASAVTLASDGSDPPLQVVLTAAELAGLQMGAELIVLSACDTGAGHFEHGRGLLGLAYAALAAGNRAAILSLWPVADDTTATFMVHFYQRLRRGLDPAAALAATQREYRASSDPHLADPSVWAPFLVYGGF